MASNTPAIKLHHLSKRFGNKSAVINLSLEIPPKKIVALIGPNGSGKTTLIKTLVGLHFPTKGSAKIFGHDITTDSLTTKKLIGYVPDNPSGFDYLTGKEFLELAASLKKTQYSKVEPELLSLVKKFKLEDLMDIRMNNYSRGNRQKLAFLAALIGQPKLLIIDEPIVGLDPESIETFGTALADFAKAGGTVLFSTHILDFGKRFANHVILMNQGKIFHQGPVSNNSSLDKIYNKINT
jgi:ABC-2 type transport system ATP-binding protein